MIMIDKYYREDNYDNEDDYVAYVHVLDRTERYSEPLGRKVATIHYSIMICDSDGYIIAYNDISANILYIGNWKEIERDEYIEAYEKGKQLFTAMIDRIEKTEFKE